MAKDEAHFSLEAVARSGRLYSAVVAGQRTPPERDENLASRDCPDGARPQ